jgi:hyperosmotically inducible protein
MKWTVGAFFVLGAAAAYAQTSDTEATAPAASAAPTAKEMRKANRLLSKQVRTALAKVKGLDSGDIVVIAKGSVVTLGGSVPDASQMPLAVTAAQGVQGVTEVHNTLSIKARGL